MLQECLHFGVLFNQKIEIVFALIFVNYCIDLNACLSCVAVTEATLS
jgi:hypothetical protein